MSGGHLADGSGIQKHSAGPAYPYIVYAQETASGLSWFVMGPAGIAVCKAEDAAEAADVAQAMADAFRARSLADRETCRYCGVRTTDVVCDEPPSGPCALALDQAERCRTCANSARHRLHPKCGLCDGKTHYARQA